MNKFKTSQHRDTEAQKKTREFSVLPLCLCVSVVNGFGVNCPATIKVNRKIENTHD
jgi:hypothetical protein